MSGSADADTSTLPGQPAPHGGSTTLRIALLASVLAFTVHLLLIDPVLEDEDYNWITTTLFLTPFALAVVACLRRGRLVPAEGLAWRLQAAAFLSFMAGGVYGGVVGDFVTYPDWSDLLWLLFYPLTFASLALLVRARAHDRTVATWLDGLLTALSVGAVITGLTHQAFENLDNDNILVFATNLAYPSADVLVLLFLVTTWQATHALDTTWVLITVGLLLFFVGDLIFLTLIADGSWPAGSLLELFWPVGVTLIGLAATTPDRLRSPDPIRDRHLVPVVGLIASIAVLVYGQRAPLPWITVALAVCCLLVAAARMVATVREVASLIQLRHEARTDFLTGLPNRRQLADELGTRLDGGDQTSLLVIDLDRFHQVNDSLGHLAGDQLLIAAGQRLLDTVKPPGVLARIGGDEFAILLPDTDPPAALATAAQVVESFRAPFDVSGLKIPVQASIGVASAPAHGRTSITLLAAADIAMYQSKRSTQRISVYRHTSDNPSRDKLELLGDLRAAVDSEQFELHFQPQISIATGRVVGLEALTRWNHPTKGQLSPGDFIPLITRSDLSRDFTAFVVNGAARTWRELTDAGHRLTMSVNISAADLSDGSLAPTVESALSNYDLTAQSLILEVTEDDVINDLLASHHTLQKLRSGGVQVSVDDYGTGQASLNYLRDLPLDELKLDRSFLQGAPDDPQNAAIVRSTIELAHALSLPIVAEGVEDERTLEWLGSLKCDVAQGFHISRPVTVTELRPWLTARSAALSSG